MKKRQIDPAALKALYPEFLELERDVARHELNVVSLKGRHQAFDQKVMRLVVDAGLDPKRTTVDLKDGTASER